MKAISVADAICLLQNYYQAWEVDYNSEEDVFEIKDLTPYPVYVGGSIDCVDFEEVTTKISWDTVEAISSNSYYDEISDPVNPEYCTQYEDDFPF